MDLANSTAIVTGASSGLGLEIARALVERGSQVYGLARRTERLEAIQEKLGEAFHPVTCDVTNEDDVKEAFGTIRNATAQIDALVNSAGLGGRAPVDELSTEKWNRQIDTNLSGTFLCTREVVPPMKEQNARSGFGGHIVNIASIAATIGNPTLSAYNASKFGVRGFSEATMKELREDGIRVTCVCPGSIETRFFEKADSTMTPNPMQAEDVAATVLHILEAPDNYLISEVIMRPLRPRG